MKYIKYFFVTIIATYCAFALYQILLQPDSLWDFKLYYSCAKDFFAGNDPYSRFYFVRGSSLPCCYLPVALCFFGIFTYFDYNTAYYIYFLFQILLLTSIVLLWKHKFLDDKLNLNFYVLFILAFNGTVYLTLTSGNICFLEQLLIWVAFYYFSQKKYNHFIFAITLASIFKLQPILFLFLLLGTENRNKLRHTLLAFIPFGIILLAQYALMPDYFKGFIKNVTIINSEDGIMSPSTFSLIHDLFSPGNNYSFMHYIGNLYIIAYLGVVSVIFFISYHTFRKLKDLKTDNKDRWYIFFSIIIYVIISMRFKDYSYIILIVPACFILDKISYFKSSVFLIILLILSSKYSSTLPFLANAFDVMWYYYPLLLAYLLFYLYVRTIFYLSDLETKKTKLS
jgi:hypothetical protein